MNSGRTNLNVVQMIVWNISQVWNVALNLMTIKNGSPRQVVWSPALKITSHTQSLHSLTSWHYTITVMHTWTYRRN